MHHHCLSICTNIAAAAILFTFVGSGRGGDVEEVDLGSGRGGNLHPSGMPSFLPAPCMYQVGGWVSRPNTSSHLSTYPHMLSYYLPELVLSSSPLLDPGEVGINHPEFHRSCLLAPKHFSHDIDITRESSRRSIKAESHLN